MSAPPPTRRLLLASLVLAGPAKAWLAHAEAAPVHPSRPTGVELAPLGRLVDQDGQPFRPGRLRGRPFILVFGYTHCPEVCPTTMHELSEVLAGLGADGDRLGVVFVTVDPERDTPGILSAYLGSFDGRILGLTGTAPDVAAVTQAFGAPAEKSAGFGDDYGMRHSAMMYLFDRYGLLAATVDYQDPLRRLPDLCGRLLRQ